MSIPTFKFNNLTRTDLLQFDGEKFINVPVYSVRDKVRWEKEEIEQANLRINNSIKTVALVGHKHQISDIENLQNILNTIEGSNSSSLVDISTFNNHVNNLGANKHLTQEQINMLFSGSGSGSGGDSFWTFVDADEEGNPIATPYIKTEYPVVSEKEITAYGVEASESDISVSALYQLSDVDPSVENAPENSILKKIGTHWKAVSGDLQPLLVSGTNIATINGQNLLNGGNILIEAGSSGSVTSVGLSAPVGLTVTGSPVTGSGTLALSFTSGYSIPTTAKQGQWDTAYSNRHTHSNKTQLDLITQSNINVLAKLSIVNGNLQIEGNAYSTGELSAYGAGGSGGTDISKLSNWSWYTSAMADYYVPASLLVSFRNDALSRLATLEAGGGGGSGYVLPTASSTTLGGVRVGSNLSIYNGVLSATNTTYGLATTYSSGLMSASDKSKLDGLSTGGGNYSLPTASASVLGGVKIGSNISISSGVISVAAPYTHPSTHSADMITTGTFPGIVKAQNNTSYTTKQVRNIILSTGNAVSSQMANGDIWIKYA